MKLYTKVMLSVGGAFLFGGAGIVVYSEKAVHGALVTRIENAGLRDVRANARRLAPAIAARDENRLLSGLHAVLDATGGAYAAALDPAGRVVAHSNVAEVGRRRADTATRAALASERPLTMELERDGQAMLELFVPVYDEARSAADEDFLLGEGSSENRGARVGTLQVGLPLADALATQRRIGGRLTRVILVLGGASVLVLLGLIRGILAPVQYLMAGTVKIGSGDYCAHIPVTSQDELGDLARGFNKMTRELALTTVSKQFLNDVLDNIQDQVIVTDASGRVSLVNPAVARTLGYAADELIGRTAGDLLAGEGVSFTVAALNKPAQLRTKSGESLPVLLSCSPITGADGSVTGWIGAARDIRDVRKLEARVHQSEKLSAVGQLAAGVAHEINNPLGVILGFAQALSRQLTPGDALELPITSIEREALRCKALVQDLLTFARTSHSDRGAMSLNEAVALSLPLISPQAKIGGVRVTTTLAEGLPPVLGNKSQLEQVIMNLAKNAIDAMPNGGNLSLETELVVGAPHSWVCLKIGDDGTGIPDAVLHKIFDPFFTTKPLGQGTGLGLSLVSEIVQKHSGELTVESRPGRTVFTVKLPARTGREIDSRLQELQRERLAEASETKGAISHD